MSQNFFDELKTTYNIDLSDQQQAAVVHTDGPCLLLAVPGGGKTTTLLSRTGYLILDLKVPSERILSITFSRASANDMKQRFEALFRGTIKGKIHFSTIHSFAYGVVMSYMKSIGQQVTLIEGNDKSQWSKGQLLRQLYFKHNQDYMSEGDYETLTNDLSFVKNLMLSDIEIRKYRSEINGFYDIYRSYESMKIEKGLIDFDDMLTKCHDILLKDDQVRSYYQNKYDYIQVDEAQDTSRLQHAIVAILCQVHMNLFYVADDDQSIYSFRGAAPAYLLNLKSLYPQAKVIKMERNYRSTGSIVSATNTLIKKNKNRYDKNIHTKKEQGIPILIREVSDRQDQYKEVMKSIEGEGLIDYGQLAILYRNNHSAVSMVNELSKTNIPFKLKGLKRKFFDHWVITDILHFLEFGEDPTQVSQFQKIYYKLKGYYISKQMVEQIGDGQGQMTVFNLLVKANNLADYQVKNIRNLEYDFQELNRRNVHMGIEFLLTEMGYLEFLMDRCGEAKSTFDSYNMMIEVLKDLAKSVSNVGDLRRGIMELENLIANAGKNESEKALTLSTIHSSKGLEWGQVHMIDLISGIFPNKDVIDSGRLEEMEEERRLFYVGMTRCKDDLTLYRVSNSVPSPFLEELYEILNPNHSKKKSLSSPEEDNEAKAYKRPVYDYKQGKSKVVTHYDPLEVGTIITHQKYGTGMVVACDKEHIVLKFHEGEKRLNYSFCMNQQLLHIKI